jgi:hypothetical protein
MNLQDDQMSGLRDLQQRYTRLAKFFQEVARQISDLETNLGSLLSSNKLVNRGVFQKIIEECTKRVEPVESLSKELPQMIETTVSNCMKSIGSERKVTLLEDKLVLINKINSRDSTANSEMVSELQDHKHRRIEYQDGYYLGETHGELRHGFGHFYHKNGNRCSGNFVNDVFEGYGEFYFANGNIYKGQFTNNCMQGKGVVYFSNGDIYEGEFKGDLMHGKGSMYYKDETRFTGDFVQNKKHGMGVRYYQNGERYEGMYVDDRRHGRGYYYYSTGAKEVRNYEKGQLRASAKQPASHTN